MRMNSSEILATTSSTGGEDHAMPEEDIGVDGNSVDGEEGDEYYDRSISFDSEASTSSEVDDVRDDGTIVSMDALDLESHIAETIRVISTRRQIEGEEGVCHLAASPRLLFILSSSSSSSSLTLIDATLL